MKDPRTAADDFFDRWGVQGDDAWGILADGCDVPPSLEVFEHGLEMARDRSHTPIAVQRYARTIVDSYKRVEPSQ